MPELIFDAGTAYDFFVSLSVLNNPARFGLRPKWAAGVRSRLAPAQRSVLAQAAQVGPLPLYWLSQLQAAEKDSTAVLAALRALEPNQILPALYFTPDMPDPVRQILRDVQQGARPSPREMDVLKADLLRINRPAPARVIETMLSAWARSAEYGEAYLDALETYANNFFLEEEQRLTPLIRKGQSHARDMAEQMDFVGLIEELTQGLHIEALQQVERVVLAPSFWSNPLIFYWLNAPRQAVLLFGFRPHTQQLVPGESVPESTLNVLKALADPTRLKILRYLGEEPQTPTQLAQRLRLRPPTVIHHLNALRVAGLVHIDVQAEGERRYALRRGALAVTWENLNHYLHDQ